MNRWTGFLKIRPGEERMSALLVGLMLFTAVGNAVGGSATEALFFARFGVELLPAMYILLGLFSFGASLVITILMGRIAKQRLYAFLPLLLGLLLIAERLIVLLNISWFFAAMWLGMNVINSLLGLLTWGLAGMACDTRQAKRLFPLFSSGAILGTVIGGLVTPLLADWLHAENLLLVWAVTLFAAYMLARALSGPSPVLRAASHTSQPGFVEEMQRGYQFVRGSPIMQWVSYSAVLFSVCFFSLALPFSRSATAQYPNADQLAGFLGLFQSFYTGAALVVSLFLANRLFARFGILPMLMVLPIIYLAGFGVLAGAASARGALAVSASFLLLVIFRFAQMAYMNGVANTSWQALFNVVPPEQRDQVRAFVSGVPEQAGTFIAGLILFIGDKTLQPQQLYLIGFVAAALTVYFIWRASRAYSQALVDALHTGQPHVFLSKDQPYPGRNSKQAPIDSWAVSAAVRGLDDPDPAVRHVSAEIISQIAAPEVAQALIHKLNDEDPQVRIAALKGLAHSQVASALLEVTACLSDPDAEVRYQAIDTLRRLSPYPRGILLQVEPLLADSEPHVRVQAALALLQTGGHFGAREMLHAMALDTGPSVRALALAALGECQDETAIDIAKTALDNEQPVVRRAAVRALAAIHPQAAMDCLIPHLSDEDRSVRSALVVAFDQIGEPALDPLVNALEDPACVESSLMALEYLPVQKAEYKIRAYVQRTTQSALRYHSLATGMALRFPNLTAGEGQLQLLFDSLLSQARQNGLNALRGSGLLIPGQQEAMAAAFENLQSPSASQRANALEILETVGEPQMVRPLLALWEAGEIPVTALADSWLEGLLADRNAWIRACTVMAVTLLSPHAVWEGKLKSVSFSDPDELVRATAEHVLSGDMQMQTLDTLSIMERILFLRRVPLLMDLQPAELKQVATIASEILFTDHQALANQGELGSEMYIIISGEVRVLITNEGHKEAYEVARRHSGDYVGEMAVISQEPRMATLIAAGPVRVLCIKQKQFESMLRERPEISLAMLRTLSQRLKEASQAVGIGA